MPAVSVLPLLLALACAGGAPDAKAPVAAPDPVPVSTVAVTTQDLPRALRVTGSLVAVDDADVAAEAAGAVSRIAADRGDAVAKGDALLEIDGTIAGLQAREASAAVAAAEVQVRQAQADCERARSLGEAGGIATAERDRLLSQCEQAARQLEAANARRALAETALSRATVRAPFAGVVAERLVSPGDYVGPGRPVVKLVATDPLRLEMSVPERAAPQIVPGAKVRFSVTERPGEVFEAAVTRISPALRERTRDLVVEAAVANPDGRLRPNSFALVRLDLPPAPALAAPAAAVVTRGDVSRVFVAVDGIAEERVVELGEPSGETVELRAGVQAGEALIVPVPDTLRDGTPVAGR